MSAAKALASRPIELVSGCVLAATAPAGVSGALPKYADAVGEVCEDAEGEEVGTVALALREKVMGTIVWDSTLVSYTSSTERE